MTRSSITIFLCIIVISAGVFIVLVEILPIFTPKVCPVNQEEEIQKIINKVNEMKSRPGYEVVYFEIMKNCVEYIRYDEENKELIVKYKTTDEIPYGKSAGIDFEWNIGDVKLPPGKYPLRVYADRVEIMGENE